MRRGIQRQKDGTYRVELPEEERDVLASLPEQLREALEAGEPTLYRLFPPAHADDDAVNEDYARLVGPGLVDGKLQALAELERTARATRLDEEELGAWLGALESLRLVLGTQLDVQDESYRAFDATDPDAPRLALYHWLSWLQEEVVQALSETVDRRGAVD
ncbi:MAG TPA: DUF2017 family protein [Gaiella sp.]|jgi:hypothetical protein|nr:DUF2017 family protein [Gaiella sp.]